MRINKFIAHATGLSRRAADAAVEAGRVVINNQPATAGQDVTATDAVTFAGKLYTLADVEASPRSTIMLNKPAGYVVSRNGQGNATVYDLLPARYHQLKPVGRLDKDSSGLLLLTNDGTLAYELTHPSHLKTKHYEISLSTPLQPLHHQMISNYGLQLEDGPSKLQLDRLQDSNATDWLVTMHEGRNRQIRRTFAALGYTVTRLHRIQFGDYQLGSLASGQHRLLTR